MQKGARHITRALAACALLLCAPGATGAAQGEPETTVLRAARIFDATSERMRTDAVIAIPGDPIVALGSAAPKQANARTIALGHATLRPDFTDTHSHLPLAPDTTYHFKTLTEMRPKPP